MRYTISDVHDVIFSVIFDAWVFRQCVLQFSLRGMLSETFPLPVSWNQYCWLQSHPSRDELRRVVGESAAISTNCSRLFASKIHCDCTPGDDTIKGITSEKVRGFAQMFSVEKLFVLHHTNYVKLPMKHVLLKFNDLQQILNHLKLFKYFRWSH